MSKFQLFLGAIAATGITGSASAGVFVFSNLAETEFVTDQNSTNSADRFGDAGSGDTKLLGSVNSNRDEFLVISVDLSSIPDTDIVTSATLTFGTDGEDGNSVFTANPINLFELVSDPDVSAGNGYNYRYQSFGPDGSSDAGFRADNVQWDGSIGEIASSADAVASDFLGTQLSSIAASASSTGGTTYDATTAAAGQSYEFVSSAAFASAVQSNLADDTLWLVFGIDALDVGADDGLRSFLRYDEDSAELTVNTVAIPEPASLTLAGLGGLLMLRRRRSA